MKTLLTFSAEDLQSLNDTQFLPVTIRCFSDGLTRHGYYFSLDSVKKAAFTLKGKPLLWGYDFLYDDAAGHEKDEIACGFVSENTDIVYEYDKEYDKTFVVIQGYIWTKYADRLVNIIERDGGVKGVSVELLLYESEENKDDPKITDAITFCFAGVTILGDNVTPAVDGAEMLVNCADEKAAFENAKNAFVAQLNNSVSQKEGGEKAEMEIEKKVDNAVAQADEQVDNAVVVDTVEAKIKETTDAYLDNGDAIYTERERKEKITVVTEIPDEVIVGTSEPETETTDVTVENATSEELDNATSEEQDQACGEQQDNACGETQDNACGDGEKVENSEVKCAELEKKCTELQNSYNELKSQYDALTVKCSELETFKANVEKAEFTNAVECALADVSDYITEGEKTEWREKSVNCASISEFTNQLKAFAFDKKTSKKSDTISRSPLVSVINEENDCINVWDKMNRQYF